MIFHMQKEVMYLSGKYKNAVKKLSHLGKKLKQESTGSEILEV